MVVCEFCDVVTPHWFSGCENVQHAVRPGDCDLCNLVAVCLYNVQVCVHIHAHECIGRLYEICRLLCAPGVGMQALVKQLKVIVCYSEITYYS